MSQPQRLTDPTPPELRAAPHADIPRVQTLEAVGLQLSRHLARSRRQGGQLTVIWIEAALHARPGTPWPDGAREALMRALSRRLRNRVRGSDEVLRVGDDSFAVVLPLAGVAEAVVIEERLQQALRGSYGVDGLLLHSDLHMGSATFPDIGRSGVDLAELARHNCIAARPTVRLVPDQTSSHSLRM
jgi:GGDEF domain-containing protein